MGQPLSVEEMLAMSGRLFLALGIMRSFTFDRPNLRINSVMRGLMWDAVRLRLACGLPGDFFVNDWITAAEQQPGA